MPSKLSMDFNSLQTIGKNEQNKNKNLIIPAWISHVVYQAKLFQWHHRLKVKKKKAGKSYHLDFIFPQKIHILLPGNPTQHLLYASVAII